MAAGDYNPSDEVASNRSSVMLGVRALNNILTTLQGLVEVTQALVTATTALSQTNLLVSSVAALPAAGTAGAGAQRMVNDADTPVFGDVVVGAGAVTVPVYSDGTDWRVG